MIKKPTLPRGNPTQHLVVAVLFAMLAGSCHAGLKEGLAAYDRADYAAALHELTPLAEKGDAKAQNKLGRMYSLGQGVPNDARVAAEWFLKAAEQGVVEAQAMLGYMYLIGDGAPQSNGKAYEWLRKAAEQGHSYAQSNLAFLYQEGKGVDKDLVLAYVMYGLSGKGGNGGALKNQNVVAQKLMPTQIKKANDLLIKWEKRSPLPAPAK